MPEPGDQREEALDRLDAKLDAFEAERARGASSGAQAATGQAYRFLGEALGGVLGGLGLGWLFDRIAHTGPWGLIGGLVIGTGLSAYLAATMAGRMSKEASKKAGPAASVPSEDDDA